MFTVYCFCYENVSSIWYIFYMLSLNPHTSYNLSLQLEAVHLYLLLFWEELEKKIPINNKKKIFIKVYTCTYKYNRTLDLESISLECIYIDYIDIVSIRSLFKDWKQFISNILKIKQQIHTNLVYKSWYMYYVCWIP